MDLKHHFVQGKLIDYISVVVTFVFLSFLEFLQFCFSSLAVQDSSITDIVCPLRPTNNQSLGSIKE